MSVAVDVPRIERRLPRFSDLWLTMNNASLASDPQFEIFSPDRRYYTFGEIAAYKDWKRQILSEKKQLRGMTLRQRLNEQHRARQQRWAEKERLAFWWVGKTLWCADCKAGSKLELGDTSHPNWIPSEDPAMVKFFCLRCRRLLARHIDASDTARPSGFIESDNPLIPGGHRWLYPEVFGR